MRRHLPSMPVHCCESWTNLANQIERILKQVDTNEMEWKNTTVGVKKIASKVARKVYYDFCLFVIKFAAMRVESFRTGRLALRCYWKLIKGGAMAYW